LEELEHFRTQPDELERPAYRCWLDRRQVNGDIDNVTARRISQRHIPKLCARTKHDRPIGQRKLFAAQAAQCILKLGSYIRRFGERPNRCSRIDVIGNHTNVKLKMVGEYGTKAIDERLLGCRHT